MKQARSFFNQECPVRLSGSIFEGRHDTGGMAILPPPLQCRQAVTSAAKLDAFSGFVDYGRVKL